MRRFIVLPIIVMVLISAALAEKTLINTDKNGAALKGYDPVAYFTDNKPVKGNPQFQAAYNGGTYYFSSAENKKLFEADPKKYEPQFGGFCAYATSKGYTAKIEPDAFQVLNGRLLLQYDTDVRDLFNKDPQGNLKKADQNWPGIVDKKGK
jgi:YHS domain-containing protein